MKWGDYVATITVYSDAECTLIVGSGILGAYREIRGTSGTISTLRKTKTIDGKQVDIWALYRFDLSTVEQGDVFTLPITPTQTQTDQYLYFSPVARFVFQWFRNGTEWAFGRARMQYDFGSGFETWGGYSDNLISSGEPIGLRFRTGTIARYDNMTINSKNYFGVDFIFKQQGGTGEVPYRAYLVISESDYFFTNPDSKPYKPKTGNTTKRAGTGTGYYPNNRIPALPTNAINAAFANVLGVGNGLTYYKLTGDCLSAITEFLYDTTLTLKFRNSEYRDAIASLVFIPYNVQADRINTKRTIYLANRGIYPNDSCDFITTPLKEIDFGEINLTAETVGYKTFADFTLTTATLYLPCYGAVNLDMHSIANGILHLRAVIDVRNGNILYRLETQSGVDDLPVLYGQYSGNCGIPVPVGGANAGATLLGAVSSIGTVATGIATGNPLSIVGGVSALAQQTAPTIDKSGALQPAAAAYGTPVPVLQIMKKIMLAPPEWGTVNGFLSGGKDGEPEYTLSNFTGFFRAAACDVSGIDGATEQEKQQIKNLLESGVYL